MERFVQSIVAGGVGLVVGLWIATFADPRSAGWLLGIALALLGTGGVVAGIRSELSL